MKLRGLDPTAKDIATLFDEYGREDDPASKLIRKLEESENKATITEYRERISNYTERVGWITPYTMDLARQYDAAMTAQARRDYKGNPRGFTRWSRTYMPETERQRRKLLAQGGLGSFLDQRLPGSMWTDMTQAFYEASDWRWERALSAGLFQSEMSTRLPGFGTDDLTEQRLRAERDIAITEASKKTLPMGPGEQGKRAYADRMAQLDQDITRTRRTIAEIDAQMKMRQFNWGIEDVGTLMQTQRSILGRGLGGPHRIGETDEQFTIRMAKAAAADIALTKMQYDALMRQYESAGELSPERRRERDQRLQQAAEDMKDAAQKFKQATVGYRTEQWLKTYGSVSQSIYGGIIDVYHGGSIQGAAKSIGNYIVETAITSAVKPFVDPLVLKLTEQIQTITDNTTAVRVLTDLYNSTTGGGGGATGADPWGGQPWGGDGGFMTGLMALAAGGSGGKSKGGSQRGVIPRELMYAFAAYGIYTNAANQSLLGGFMTGAMGGAAVGASVAGPAGGLIGAAIGGTIGFLGSLFGHKSSKNEAADRSPAFYNQPSDFEYGAYRMRATATTVDLALASRASYIAKMAPIVNIYVDGVKTAVKTELATQTSLGVTSRTNAYVDLQSPL